MSNMPANLSPETSAWLQAQMVINNAKTAAILRAEINKVDEWANGIFAALRDVLRYQLGQSPDLAGELGSRWSQTAEDFDRIYEHGQKPRPHETLEYLEARKMLFQYFAAAGTLSKPENRI